jgi:hypothetical protein
MEAYLPRDSLLFLAVGLLAVSLAVFLYGEWLWIIQTNGDAYVHAAGALYLVGGALVAVGLYQRIP